MTYTHDDIIELLGAYALDAVDPEEREEVELHLPSCPRCAAEVAEHREVAAMLAHSGAPAPEGLWHRLVDSLEEPPPQLDLPTGPPRAESPTSATGPADAASGSVVSLDAARRGDRDGRSGRRWLPVGAVAAAAVVLVLGLVLGTLVGDSSPPVVDRAEVAAPSLADLARQALHDPDARRVELVSESGDLEAVAAIQPDGSGYLVGTTLPTLDEGSTYQLWGVSEQAVISLGVLGSSPRVVAFHTDDSVQQLAITQEVAGGVVSSQNQPVVAGEVS